MPSHFPPKLIISPVHFLISCSLSHSQLPLSASNPFYLNCQPAFCLPLHLPYPHQMSLEAPNISLFTARAISHTFPLLISSHTSLNIPEGTPGHSFHAFPSAHCSRYVTQLMLSPRAVALCRTPDKALRGTWPLCLLAHLALSLCKDLLKPCKLGQSHVSRQCWCI